MKEKPALQAKIALWEGRKEESGLRPSKGGGGGGSGRRGAKEGLRAGSALFVSGCGRRDARAAAEKSDASDHPVGGQETTHAHGGDGVTLHALAHAHEDQNYPEKNSEGGRGAPDSPPPPPSSAGDDFCGSSSLDSPAEPLSPHDAPLPHLPSPHLPSPPLPSPHLTSPHLPLLLTSMDHRTAKDPLSPVLRVPVRNEAVSNYWKQQTLKLELELKEEKVASLARELADMNFTGKSEEEVALLKKAKHDLELRVKDQEEELDDLAGQVQMLEGARLRLEMSIEQMRKENRKEVAQRDDEVDELRNAAAKKLKGLESLLESEHDERTQLVREKHELERRLMEAQSRSLATVDEDAFHRVKKELKKTKALLKDTQTMLEKTQSEGSNRLLLRQLKTQLEDAEFAKTAAVKARQSTETDFAELQNQLDESLRAKKEAEEKLARVNKEKVEMQTQLEESEEEVAEVMKKYKASVSQLSVDQINISEQVQLIADLEHDKQVLQEKLSELSSKVEVLEGETANIHTQRRLQMKIKEVESKLDLESTTRQRLDSQITRLKDQVERMSAEADAMRLKEAQAADHLKKMGRQLREAKEDVNNLQQKLTDSLSRKQEVEKQLELSESEIMTLKSDLKLAFKRIEDLQQALQGDISDSDSEMSDSKGDLLGPPLNDLMSVIKEDAEDDYRESFA